MTASTASSNELLLPPSPDDVCDSLRELVSPKSKTQDPSAINIRSSALIARLKAYNRTANSATRARKQATTDARNEMDQTHLGLQNLLYEKRHLEREIEKCRQFASIYQDIPLYSLEEFQKLAPEELRTEEVLLDEHQLMINRLDFELAERQRLDAVRKELIGQRDALSKESKWKNTTMDGVKAQLEALMKAASEIQKKVDELVPSVHPGSNQP